MPKASIYPLSLLLYFLFLSTTASVFAQSYIVDVRRLSVEEGLAGRYVVGVQEDQNGFVWVSTWLGLNRFDGYEFKEFPNEKYGFRFDKHSDILIDPNGKLWLINLVGRRIIEEKNSQQHIDIFNPISEKLENDLISQQFPFKTDAILSIRNDKNKNIWIGLLNGEIYKYDGKKLTLVFKSVPFIQFEITSDQTLATLLPDEKTIQFYNLQGEILQEFFLENLVFNFLSDQNGGIILLAYNFDGTNYTNDFLQLHPQKPIKKIRLSAAKDKYYNFQNAENIITFNADKYKNIWVNYGNQVLLFDENFNLIYDFGKKIDSNAIGLVGYYFDSKNKTWAFSTDGLYIIKLRKNPFSNYLIPPVKFADTRGIAADQKGNIYVNQENTYKIIPDENIVVPINVDGARALTFTQDEKLLVGNYNPFIYEYDLISKIKKEYSFYKKGEEKLFFGATNVIHQSTKTGTIYLGTSKKGIAILDREQHKIFPFVYTNSFGDIQNVEIFCFAENDTGIWIGTSSGFYLLNEEHGIIQHFTLNKKDEPPIGVLHIHIDQNKQFWLGTFNHGVYNWNASEGILSHLTSENGLSDNTIYGIYSDNFNHLWMSSNLGLMQVNKENLEVKTYLPSDGIPHEEFNTTSHFQHKNGKLYFGGLRGVTAFDPKDFSQNIISQKTPIPKISQIEFFDKKNEKWVDVTLSFLKSNQLQLSTQSTSLKIKLAATDMINADRNQFSYRMESSNPWIQLENNILEIQNIPRGKSILEIRNRIRNEKWVGSPLELVIYRQQPFYFRLPFLLAILTAILTLFYFNKKRKQKQKVDQDAKIRDAITTIKESLAPIPIESEEPPAEATPIQEKQKILEETPPDEWLEILSKNANLLIEDRKFSIIELAATMNLSERQFRRKLKQKTNLRPADYMREIRLVKAEYFLKNNTYSTVAEVCYAVGFSTPKHFSKIFKERFGKNPSFYLDNRKSS